MFEDKLEILLLNCPEEFPSFVYGLFVRSGLLNVSKHIPLCMISAPPFSVISAPTSIELLVRFEIDKVVIEGGTGGSKQLSYTNAVEKFSAA